MAELHQARFGFSRDYRRDALAWIRDNPKLWEAFKRFAGEMAAQRRRFGVKLIAERVRWEVALGNIGGPYKINNNVVAYLAHYLEQECPEVCGLIRHRSVKF